VFEITAKFISVMDVLVIGENGVDEILPHINELKTALVNFPDMPLNYEGTEKVKGWADKLADKQASDCLTEEETRQLKLDLDTSCQQFKDVVCV
jgi:hypothetical protein